ncbi:MAG: QueT transporter family protein [Clostridiales bacterium]|nr:QueT transporter family protein [Clostridiales bacterium]
MHKSIRYLTQAAVIAALYVALTYLTNLAGLASGAIQFRLSEALTILPFFTPAAIPGLFVGCFLANLLTGCIWWDIVFGSLATLAGALGTWFLRKSKWLAPVPPIVANIVIVPLILHYGYGFTDSYGILSPIPYFAVTVGIGEIVCCGVLGMALLFALLPVRKKLF